MKYRYTYSLLEAACALCAADHQAVQASMSSNDQMRAQATKMVATEKCRECPKYFVECPEWKGDIDEPWLDCPQQYESPPSFNDDGYTPKRRFVPAPDEASNTVIEMCRLLQAALSAGELAGTPDAILRSSLIDYWVRQYPNEKPEFLFPPIEVPAVDTDLLLIIATLIQQIKVTNEKQEDIVFNANKILGKGFSESRLEKIFAQANRTLATRNANAPAKQNKIN